MEKNDLGMYKAILWIIDNGRFSLNAREAAALMALKNWAIRKGESLVKEETKTKEATKRTNTNGKRNKSKL